MGYSWSRFRNDLHSGSENEQEAAYRLGRTPPEMWSPEDWILARNLRYRRELARTKAEREGKSVARALIRYPEGPFWPTVSLDAGARRAAYIKFREEEEEVSKKLALGHGRFGHHNHHGHHGHGHHYNHGNHGHHGNHDGPYHGGHDGGGMQGGGMQGGWRNGRRNDVDEWNELL